MKRHSVAVIGAGNVGCAMAAHLAISGVDVRLYSPWQGELDAIAERGGLQVQGVVEGFARIPKLTTSLIEAVSDADLVVVVVPAYVHSEVTQDLAMVCQAGQTVIFQPATLGTALQFDKHLGPDVRGSIIIGVSQTSLYSCRKVDEARVNIRAIKEGVMVATLPQSAAGDTLRQLDAIFGVGRFAQAGNVLAVELSNINPVYHCPPTLFNIGKVENGDRQPFFEYSTPAVVNVIDALDRERLALAAGVGLEIGSFWDFLKGVYGVDSGDLVSNIRASYGQGGASLAPDTLTHRYILEDVPYGLVPWASFGDQIGVDTPVCDSLIHFFSLLCNKDFMREGRSTSDFGIDGLSAVQVMDMVSGTLARS